MAFGDKEFFKVLSERDGDGDAPPLEIISSTFFHFIFVQISALLLSIVAKAKPVSSLPDGVIQTICDAFPEYETLRPIFGMTFWAISFLTFLYSISLALAATSAIFRMMNWFQIHTETNPKDDQSS